MTQPEASAADTPGVSRHAERFRWIAKQAIPWHECPMRKAAFLFVLFATSTAVASPKDDADAAISRGIRLRRQRDDAAALEEFQRAKDLSPSPRATAQVGLALQALGRWVEAEAQLEEAMSNAHDPWIISNRATLESSVGTIKNHLGSLEIVGLPAGAEVFVEQRRVGVLPLNKPVRATAGTVALEVRAPGYLPVTRNVSIAPGALSREMVRLTAQPVEEPRPEAIEVSPPPAPVPAVSPSATDTGPGTDWHRPAAWVAGSAAAALLAGGVVALVVRSDKNDQLQRRLGVDKTCAQSGDAFSGSDASTCASLATAKETWTAIAVGTLAAAGAAAATAVLLVATRPVGSSDPHASNSAAAPGIAAGVAPHTALLWARWLF